MDKDGFYDSKDVTKTIKQALEFWRNNLNKDDYAPREEDPEQTLSVSVAPKSGALILIIDGKTFSIEVEEL